jgi:hypothetical protein
MHSFISITRPLLAGISGSRVIVLVSLLGNQTCNFENPKVAEDLRIFGLLSIKLPEIYGRSHGGRGRVGMLLP